MLTPCVSPPDAQVVDSKTVQDRPARAGQKAQRVAECTVGDETGTILLSARNEQGEPPPVRWRRSRPAAAAAP
jgi:hypothetical protein